MVFLFGQGPPPPITGPSPFRGVNQEDTLAQMQAVSRLRFWIGDLIINQVATRGFEEILAALRIASYLPTEVATALLSPGSLNSGEAEALDQIRAALEQAQSAQQKLERPLQQRMQDSDP